MKIENDVPLNKPWEVARKVFEMYQQQYPEKVPGTIRWGYTAQRNWDSAPVFTGIRLCLESPVGKRVYRYSPCPDREVNMEALRKKVLELSLLAEAAMSKAKEHEFNRKAHAERLGALRKGAEILALDSLTWHQGDQSCYLTVRLLPRQVAAVCRFLKFVRDEEAAQAATNPEALDKQTRS